MSRDPPLFLDIDGTLTRREGGLDAAVIGPLRSWDAPIILATGKAFPYPIALCHYLSIPERVVAENGGVVCVDDHVELTVNRDHMTEFKGAVADAGFDFGWGAADTVNRWRETEVAMAPSVDRDTIEGIAERHGLEVIDSGYAYHIKDPSVTKGRGLERACTLLQLDPETAVAIGDSENDEAMFELAGRSFALANADAVAAAAADTVVADGFATGMLSVLEEISST